MKHPKETLTDALRNLNYAAYSALRAGKDSVEYPDLDRQTLREIARKTDIIYDDHQKEAK